MKKFVLKNVLSILLILITIVSIFANFWRPNKDVQLQLELSYDIDDPKSRFQPIFIDKQWGITKTINARLNFSKRTRDSIKLDCIELKTMRFSGLRDYKFTDVFFLGKPGCKNCAIIMKMSPFLGKKDTVINIKNRDIWFSKGDSIVTFIDYKKEYEEHYDQNTKQNECFEFPITDDGRICNFKLSSSL